jgi:spermidine/putrescine transport system ATP-binding protein
MAGRTAELCCVAEDLERGQVRLSDLPNSVDATLAHAPALLSARGLTKRFGRQVAVAGVDLDIRERAFTTLLGPSGCGKTTILRMIGGFETPDAGSLVLDGATLAGVPPELRPVNTVFQSYALFPHLNVFENVAFSLRLRNSGNIERKVKNALDAVRMSDYVDRFPNELSGGEQQRVAVARAIIAQPRLLLLDEPLSALDRRMRAHLQIELKDLQRRLGIAFIYVTHDQAEAFALSDVVVVMNNGEVVQVGAPQEIYARPVNAFVADFIGDASLVRGKVVAVNGVGSVLDTRFGRLRAPALDSLTAGDDGCIVLRPESLVESNQPQAITGTATHVIYQGNGFVVEVVADGTTFRYGTDHPPAPGAPVRLSIVPDKSFITRVER